MKKLIAGLALILSFPVLAQKNSAKNKLVLYSYQPFGCDNKGYFDPSKYKKEEIDGTYKLLYPLSWSPFSSLVVFNPAKFDMVRKNNPQLLQQVEKEYQTRRKELTNLTIINLPVWKKKHAEAIQLLDNEYQLRKETLMAYADPKSLQNSKFHNTCKETIDAITSDNQQKMYAYWKNTFEEKYNDTSQAKEVFDTKWNDERKDDIALIDLINIYNTCANHSFRNTIEDDDILFKAFDKIFVQLKRNCDEP